MTWVGRGNNDFLVSKGALSFEGGETECGVTRFHHDLYASKIYRIYPQARCLVFMFADIWDPGSISGLGRSAGEGIGYPLQYCWVFLVAQLVKNPIAMWKTWVWSLGWEDSPGKRKGYPLQYSGLKNSMDYTVHGVTKSRTRLSNFHFHLSTQPVIPGIHPEHQLITEFYSLYLLDTSDLSHSIQLFRNSLLL